MGASTRRGGHRRVGVGITTVALAGVMLGTAVSAKAAASGCTSGGEVCLQTFDNGTYVGNAEVRFIHSDGIVGHAHLYGAGYDVTTPDQSLAGGFCA